MNEELSAVGQFEVHLTAMIGIKEQEHLHSEQTEYY